MARVIRSGCRELEFASQLKAGTHSLASVAKCTDHLWEIAAAQDDRSGIPTDQLVVFEVQAKRARELQMVDVSSVQGVGCASIPNKGEPAGETLSISAGSNVIVLKGDERCRR
jgi:hypothetical protein